MTYFTHIVWAGRQSPIAIRAKMPRCRKHSQSIRTTSARYSTASIYSVASARTMCRICCRAATGETLRRASYSCHRVKETSTFLLSCRAASMSTSVLRTLLSSLPWSPASVSEKCRSSRTGTRPPTSRAQRILTCWLFTNRYFGTWSMRHMHSPRTCW